MRRFRVWVGSLLFRWVLAPYVGELVRRTNAAVAAIDGARNAQRDATKAMQATTRALTGVSKLARTAVQDVANLREALRVDIKEREEHCGRARVAANMAEAFNRAQVARVQEAKAIVDRIEAAVSRMEKLAGEEPKL